MKYSIWCRQRIVSLGAGLLLSSWALAQGPFDKAVLHGETDKARAIDYAPGEEMVFTLSLQGAETFGAGQYFVTWSRTGDDGEKQSGKVDAATLPLVVKTKLAKPGFVRLEAVLVDGAGKAYKKSFTGNAMTPEGRRALNAFERSDRRVFFDGGAGVRVDTLKSVDEPADFDAFWAARKARLARVPMTATVKEHPSRDKRVRILTFSVACAGPRPVTGWVTVPTDASRKYPATLTMHGYGSHFVQSVPSSGSPDGLYMFINAHGYELEREDEYYTEFYNAIKSNGYTFGLDSTWQNKSTDTAYFGWMIYRIMRALQYLKSFPEWDGRNLCARGGSMGGLQTMWAAGIDPDVSEARPSIPWCCDMGGRHTLKRLSPTWGVDETPAMRYFDPVNFAKRVNPKCRLEIVRAGLGDYCCPPSGVAILYNNLRCDKKINWVQGSTHGYVPSEKHQAFSLSAPAADPAWDGSAWLSAPDAPVCDDVIKDAALAAPGTSWFSHEQVNEKAVKSARWVTAGLGVYDVYVNGTRLEREVLKPGFTHNAKTKYSFAYDVTPLMRCEAGGKNVFAAEVSAGWWRDKICTPAKSKGFVGRKSAFRSILEVTFADGSVKRYGTNTADWKAGVAGPVIRAAIFDGEVYDARLAVKGSAPASLGASEVNTEFAGEIVPTAGAEIYLRHDLAMAPQRAYAWQGVTGEATNAFGTVRIVRTFAAGEKMTVNPDETLVLDFGQNAAAVPSFTFRGAFGTRLLALPAEMLNDCNGLKSRGNDGPEGSVYRVNLRASHKTGQRVEYTFAGGRVETFVPRFTFFGYRYLSVTVSAPVEIARIESVPVTSIRKDQELGSLEVGDAALNRFIKNVYWGQLSNYLSVPTDCPQRNERLGWAADTQVFCEAASFNADVYGFLCKWMRDMRDSQHACGGFPSVAPFAQYGNQSMRVGWADAGVIVPYTMWKQFGDRRIVDENWLAMTRYLAYVEQTRYAFEAIRKDCENGQYADWLSFEDYEPCNGTAYEKGPDGRRRPRPAAVTYWEFLGACYWLNDAKMMATMAKATGRTAEAAYWQISADRALSHLRARFIDPSSGLLIENFRHLQGAALFALNTGLVTGAKAVAATCAAYRKNLADHGGCNMTGFLGTSILMDTLTENGMNDIAYDLLFNHNFPSWLYSVDQGATTVWERWNSYTKEKGFGPVGMNSFNHYAYGAVLAWIYKTAAGIAADPACPGFKHIIMAPKPDRRLGHLTAEYRSAAGLIKSAWRYEGAKWVWSFTIPAGATAAVTLPGEKAARNYTAGTYTVTR